MSNLDEVRSQVGEAEAESEYNRIKRSKASAKLEKDIPPQPRPSATGKLDTSNVRRTNRISKSCFSCKRRKVKCNFEIPCDRCITRNRAHLCSREPIIVDGLLVNTGDEIELKFSQENEVLRRKIRELEETVLRLKQSKMESSSEYEDDDDSSSDLDEASKLTTKRSCNEKEEVKLTKRVDSKANNSSNLMAINNLTNSNKPKVEDDNKSDDNMEPAKRPLKRKKPSSAGHTNKQSDMERSNKWDSYSITISLLNKGIAEGLQDDDDKLNGNTEEWSRITNKRLVAEIKKDDEKADVWNYQLKSIRGITKSHSDSILRRALQVFFLHNVLDKDTFLQEYDSFWADDSDTEKHVTPLYSKPSKEYLFMSQYYVLMCIGMYFADDSLQEELGFSDEEWDFFPRVFFSCSLECLMRGRFMTYPNIKSVQTFALMKMCSHALGGIHLQNCILSAVIYNARKLNLDKIGSSGLDLTTKEAQLKIRCWWALINVDWYESQFRYSLIAQGTFSTPMPERWLVEGEKLRWDSYYQIFMTKVATIKKTYYFDDELLRDGLTLECLKKADLELRILEVECKKDFEMYMDSERLNVDETFATTLEYINFLVEYVILQERLDVNSKMSTFMKHEEWNQQCYLTCYNCAKTIILRFSSPEISFYFKKPWFVPQIALSAAVFLLVDCMLNKQIIRYQKETIFLVKKVIPVLGSYRPIMRPALRGIYVIQMLIGLMLGTDKDSIINGLKTLSRKPNPLIETEKPEKNDKVLDPTKPEFEVKSESMALRNSSMNDSLTNQKTAHPMKYTNSEPTGLRKASKTKENQFISHNPQQMQSKTPFLQRFHSNTVVPLSSPLVQFSLPQSESLTNPLLTTVTKSPRVTSDHELSSVGSSPSIEYSSLQKFNEERQQSLARGISLAPDQFAYLRLQQQSHLQQQTQNLPPVPLSQNGQQPFLHLQQPAAVAQNSPAIGCPESTPTSQRNHAFPVTDSNDNNSNLPQVHTTILDILGDNGWEQFLDTIDDFAMTFDVN